VKQQQQRGPAADVAPRRSPMLLLLHIHNLVSACSSVALHGCHGMLTALPSSAPSQTSLQPLALLGTAGAALQSESYL